MCADEHPVRWAIAGPGRIAAKVAADFAVTDGAELIAVGSRSADRAAAFADRFGVPRRYGSYRQLLADDDVDAVYIATTHPQHLKLALAAIQAGKGILVEKTFTATVAGAEQLINAARTASVFCMEAMWTRFQPVLQHAKALVDRGEIGEVRQVSADLGVDADYDPHDRWFNPAIGGGAMLDVGVYPVSFAQWFLGTPDKIEAVGSLAPSGVDVEAAVLLGFPAGRAAVLQASMRNRIPGTARIVGTDGWIDVLPRFHHPDTIVVHRSGADPHTITAPPNGGGYSHELAEVSSRVRHGHTESAVMPLDDTLTVQRILGEVCSQLGVSYVEDDELDLS